ncbi:Ribonuclease Z [Leucobacter sp. 7(1)]|uniref:MBL fold metallo-hydrolase n=1 Tax=Leucobacter sp. 7(1) TaxID=1255613 RepID=UPI00097ECEDF|nr:MBL fold metallo-hydrolase [Leucobacter sp. 7(1)]SJN13255.1 Ribonuclease Z [Leucobacter sp. 7(1)]
MHSNALEITLTGTGTPIPVPDRAGPGVCIRTPDATVQIDTGRSTVLRLAEAGVNVGDLTVVCLTHHHSDHTTDLSDVLMSAWIMNPDHDIDLVTPTGLAADFARSVLTPLEGDLEFRRIHRGVTDIARPRVREFTPERKGTRVWEDGETRIDAVAVRHEPVEHAVGYRVSWGEHAVVVSGDTRACAELEELARGADVLVHEVVAPDRVPPHRTHTIDYHALPHEVGALAERAGVGVLVLTHLWPAPQNEADVASLLDGVRAGGFTGEVVVGCDLTRVTVHGDARTVTVPTRPGVPGLHAPAVPAVV